MDNQIIEVLNKQGRLLNAIALLLLRQGNDDTNVKPEFLLAAGGMGYQEIAELLAKKPDAVRMLIKRNKNTIQALKSIK